MSDNNEVKLHFLDYWKVIKQRAGLITLVFLLVMVTAGITTYFMPRKYLSKVSMEVRPDRYKPTTAFDQSSPAYDPQFVATQFQILKKAEILDPVIDQLDLIKVYSGDGPRLNRQYAMAMLVRSLEVQEVRNTPLIELGAWHTNREIAANIANTIAVVYRNYRMDSLQKSLERGLSQFQDEVNRQKEAVEKLSVEAALIRQRDGIVDPNTEDSGTPLQTADRVPVTAEQAANEQRLKVSQIKTSLAKIEALKTEELLEALHTLGIEDQTVSQNLPQLLQARVDEANLLNSGLGVNHPRIKALRAKMETYNTILGEALESIRRSETTKLEVAEKTLEVLDKRVQEVNTDAIAKKAEQGGYVEVKAKYINAKRILEAAEMRLSTARIEKAIDIDPVIIHERAQPPLDADYPPVKQYLLFAAFMGVVMGVLLAFFIEYLDTSVRTVDDVERYLKTSVLAVIPKGIPILLKLKSEHPDAEAYRILRANVEFNKPSPDAKTITVISAGPGEGKSTTLNNLAFTCAKGGYNVLVIDADLRRPTQHTFFDTDNRFGLVDYLTGAAQLDSIVRPTKIDNLSFIPSGELPPDAVGILNSEQMIQLIEKVKNQYDLVFFDSPPILGVSDGSVLASEMDMTVMVVQHRRFPRTMLLRVKQAIEQVGGTLIGVVLNNVDTRHDDEAYSYYNAYQEYYAAPHREAPAPMRAPAAPRKNVGAAATAARQHLGDGSDY